MSGISAPDFRAGFGRNVTGGAGKRVITVGSTADFVAAFPRNEIADCILQFSAPEIVIPNNTYIRSNVTIDGTLNGQNGVNLLQPKDGKRQIVIEDPASNILICGLNCRGDAVPSGGGAEFDLLSIDATNGSAIDGVLIDRCTLSNATDGALDIVGNARNITVQRCLIYGTAVAMLMKYQASDGWISLLYNVFAHNGERCPQIKGARQIDICNLIVYCNDVAAYPDGTPVSPYGLRMWSAGAASDSPGNVVANVAASAFIGVGAQMVLVDPDPGASNSGIYIDIDSLYCSPLANYGGVIKSPRETPNPIPAEFRAIVIPVSDMRTQMMPYIGAPNRSEEDQLMVDQVTAALYAVPGQPTGNSYLIMWDALDSYDDGSPLELGATVSYEVEAATPGGEPAIRTNTGISMDITPDARGTTYRVRACLGTGADMARGAWSNSVTRPGIPGTVKVKVTSGK